MRFIKGCVNEKITPLNKHKYGVFERHFTGGKTYEGYWEKENPIPVSLCHHKSNTDYVEI
jgi:hypothetical protein